MFGKLIIALLFTGFTNQAVAAFSVADVEPAPDAIPAAQDLTYQLHFKAFCRNDADEVQVAEINEPVTYRLEFNADGSTNKTQEFHHLKSAGYEVYVTLEILREPGAQIFQIRLTPWRKVPGGHDISFGTGFVEQEKPAPLPRLGVAVAETINPDNGSYCTLTSTISSK